ncbi:double-stranded RNA-binding protein Staufen homolog isoform X1 [Zophobas morio]|uniref:double-stranded RNA-binding protein Staufen homolog isoform X1 n=2 Tax=Zophobas morio TaxID=2755281 RepID=UPI003082C466
MLCYLQIMAIFLLLLFHLSLLHAMSIEDLQSIFGNKHCIEASLFSLSSDKSDKILLMEESTQTEETLLNNTRRFDASMTSKINELAQYNGIEFVYKLLTEEGPPHAKTFTVALILGDETYEASGPSLKKAKQSAAGQALRNTLYEHPPERIQENQENLQTPTVLLNNVAMKLGIHVSYYLLNGQEEQTINSYGVLDEPYGKSKSYYPKINSSSDPLRVPVEDPQLSGPFTVKVKVGELLSVKGVAHTVQAARHDAAFKALRKMEEQALFRDNVCSKEDSVEECKKTKESIKSPISRVYEAGQKHNLKVEFNIISETGKSHKKVFVTQCIMGDFITEGEGFSKKESKKTAAEKMLKYLSHLPEKYNENGILRGLSNKKKKKKNPKIIKENVSSVMKDLLYMASSLWPENEKITTNNYQSSHDDDKTTGTSKGSSLKNKILEVGSKLNIPMEFTDLSNYGDIFFSLMTLGVDPPHLCLGKAATREKSHEAAAVHGIKYLHNSGIFEKTKFVQFQSLLSDVAMADFEDEAEYNHFRNVEKNL